MRRKCGDVLKKTRLLSPQSSLPQQSRAHFISVKITCKIKFVGTKRDTKMYKEKGIKRPCVGQVVCTKTSVNEIERKLYTLKIEM